MQTQAISNKVLAELKQTFLEAYDENCDGKIDIREVSCCFYLSVSLLSRRLFVRLYLAFWRSN